MSKKIHLTVGILCVKDGKLLMVHEYDNNKLVINQPAGHIEPGEGFKQAALRETLEETGYRVKLESILGLSALSAPNGTVYHRASFLASVPDQIPSKDIDPDIDHISWMTPEEIRAQNNHRSVLVELDLDRYLNGVRYPLEMIAENQ